MQHLRESFEQKAFGSAVFTDKKQRFPRGERGEQHGLESFPTEQTERFGKE
jgi:hypothetical protein